MIKIDLKTRKKPQKLPFSFKDGYTPEIDLSERPLFEWNPPFKDRMFVKDVKEAIDGLRMDG